jgi:hypothetical protein
MWGGNRARVRNQFRASVFRNFLMQTYGIEYMQSGPVLDVAGGRGELSFEMNNCQGVRTILVEPRGPTALN